MKYKKYIILIALFAVYIFLIAYTLINLDNYVETASPIYGKSVTVIVDAGHGGEDGGAVDNGIVEKDINLSVSKKLYELLKVSGINVKMTRTDDTMVNPKGNTLRERKVSDMKNRLELFNQSSDNIVLSIHQNKFTQEKYNGAQVFYSQNNMESSELAECVRNNLTTLLQPLNKRECKPAEKNIYLLYNSKVPSVIIECGFISNVNEAKLLKSDEYQNKLAFAIFTGFMDYYNKRGS